jgi:hypothetical protein
MRQPGRPHYQESNKAGEYMERLVVVNATLAWQRRNAGASNDNKNARVNPTLLTSKMTN